MVSDKTVGTIWLMDLAFKSTFDNQSMSIGCVGKLGHLFGFLRHYLLNIRTFNDFHKKEKKMKTFFRKQITKFNAGFGRS